MMIRRVLALVAGLVAAIILVWLIQTIGHSVYPPPPGLDFSDPEKLRAFIAELPVGALLFVIVSYAVATLVGGFLACFIAREKPLIYASVVGGFVLLGTVLNITTIPHPMWFSVVAILSIFVMIWLAAKLRAPEPPG